MIKDKKVLIWRNFEPCNKLMHTLDKRRSYKTAPRLLTKKKKNQIQLA